MLKSRRFIADFRSDTVTEPTQNMLKSVLNIKKFNDCVLGTDPNVEEFEQTMAKKFNKEKGLFMLTGTMANQISILTASSRCSKPLSVIGHRNCHLMRWESAGISFTSRALPIMVPDYHLSSFINHSNIRQDVHVAQTKIALLENTLDGHVVNYTDLKSIYKFSSDNDIHVHLDGCRIWHAAIKENRGLHEYGDVCDSISLCFSKAIGAPIGAMLLGSKFFVDSAKYYRKMLGGGLRQASVLTEQCKYAFDSNYKQLSKTHDAALLFFNSINPRYRSYAPDTNIVFLKNVPDSVMRNSSNVSLLPPNNGKQRIVFHLQNIEHLQDLIKLYQ
eukprot:NODE_220_length_13988_cov_0.426885.p4 type:complete len:331 gc:universal NODE_220_length_13988_cov_0.426885:5898-4906(-)